MGYNTFLNHSNKNNEFWIKPLIFSVKTDDKLVSIVPVYAVLFCMDGVLKFSKNPFLEPEKKHKVYFYKQNFLLSQKITKEKHKYFRYKFTLDDLIIYINWNNENSIEAKIEDQFLEISNENVKRTTFMKMEEAIQNFFPKSMKKEIINNINNASDSGDANDANDIILASTKKNDLFVSSETTTQELENSKVAIAIECILAIILCLIFGFIVYKTFF